MSSLADIRPEIEGHVLAPDDFRKIAGIMKESAGITLGENSEKLIISRLSRHLNRLGLEDFRTYLAHVTSPRGKPDLVAMIDALTTNTTRFFREAEHLDLLETQVMPGLIRKARAGGRVRLWSAACSSGEEPYSIAATILRSFPDAGRFDVKILATDISRPVLKRAALGLYDPRAVRDLPVETRRLLFEGEEGADHLAVRPNLKDLVTFRYLNFVDPWPVSGPFDVIFCRNVAIYMDRTTQMKVWSGMDRVLAEDGTLFIGHSERIGPELAHRFELFAPTSFRRPRSRHTKRN